MKNHVRSRTRALIAIIGRVLVGILIAAMMGLLFGLIVMWLWNWLMPEIFGLGGISFWQAWGLVVLSHILFKSSPHHKHHHPGDEKWKKHFREKYCSGKSSSKPEPPQSSATEFNQTE